MACGIRSRKFAVIAVFKIMFLKNCSIYCKSWFFIVLGILAHTRKIDLATFPSLAFAFSPEVVELEFPTKAVTCFCYVQKYFIKDIQ